MKQLFIIQCHEVDPAKKLGELIKCISPDFEVFYAYDILKIPFEARPFGYDPTKSHGFVIGYYTIDQGLFHASLWKYLIENLPKYDYYHIVSQNDLVGLGSLKFESEFASKYDFYGYYGFKGKGNIKIPSGITWYGVSYEVAQFIHSNFYRYLDGWKSIWLLIGDRDSYSEGFTGSFDEYFIGYIFQDLGKYFNGFNDCLRLLKWPVAPGYSDKLVNNELVDTYGKLSSNPSSPVILMDTPRVTELLVTNPDAYCISGRKFEFMSDAYKNLVNLIKNGR